MGMWFPASLERVRHNNYLSEELETHSLHFPRAAGKGGGGHSSYFTTFDLFVSQNFKHDQTGEGKEEAAEAGGAAEGLSGEPSALFFSDQKM